MRGRDWLKFWAITAVVLLFCGLVWWACISAMGGFG